jgi:hypothetical protein
MHLACRIHPHTADSRADCRKCQVVKVVDKERCWSCRNKGLKRNETVALQAFLGYGLDFWPHTQTGLIHPRCFVACSPHHQPTTLLSAASVFCFCIQIYSYIAVFVCPLDPVYWARCISHSQSPRGIGPGDDTSSLNPAIFFRKNKNAKHNLSHINWFCGVVGYHFCLTHRRS